MYKFLLHPLDRFQDNVIRFAFRGKPISERERVGREQKTIHSQIIFIHEIVLMEYEEVIAVMIMKLQLSRHKQFFTAKCRF